MEERGSIASKQNHLYTCHFFLQYLQSQFYNVLTMFIFFIGMNDVWTIQYMSFFFCLLFVTTDSSTNYIRQLETKVRILEDDNNKLLSQVLLTCLTFHSKKENE